MSDLRERLAPAIFSAWIHAKQWEGATEADRRCYVKAADNSVREVAAWLRDEATKDRRIAEHAALYTTRRRYIAMAEALEERADALDPQPERTA